MSARTIVAIISTFAALIPFIAGVIVFKKAGLAYRLFTFFLLIGFLNDLFGLLFFFFKEQFIAMGLTKYVNDSLFYFFLLVEALFFAWFIFYTTNDFPVKDTAFIFLLMLPVAWALCFINFKIIDWKIFPLETMFTTVYKMIAALLAAWSIWKLKQVDYPLLNKNIVQQFRSRKETMTNVKTILLGMRDQYQFWFLVGIFFYCAFTFIITAFIQTVWREKIWWLQNVDNTIAYLIYAYAFLLIGRKKESVKV
jgi:hypothetical protein